MTPSAPRPGPTCLAAIVLWLGCVGALGATGASVIENRGPDMSEFIQAARDAVQHYDQRHDMLLLRKAGEQLERVDQFAPGSAELRAKTRLQTLGAWLDLIQRIDRAKDPNFDPADTPATKLTPRSGPGQRPYLPGTDPKLVTDPQVRADYEQAIATNQQKAERRRQHWDLDAVDMEISDGARRFIQQFYTATPADQDELRAAFAAAGLSAQRQRQLAAPATGKR